MRNRIDIDIRGMRELRDALDSNSEGMQNALGKALFSAAQDIAAESQDLVPFADRLRPGRAGPEPCSPPWDRSARPARHDSAARARHAIGRHMTFAGTTRPEKDRKDRR